MWEEEEEEQQQQEEHQEENGAPMELQPAEGAEHEEREVAAPSTQRLPSAFGSPTSRPRTSTPAVGRKRPRQDASPKKKKKLRSSTKSGLHGAIENAINIPAGPLVTVDEIFIVTKCFGKVHGKCPIAQEADKIAEMYNEFFAANMFRGQPGFAHL